MHGSNRRAPSASDDAVLALWQQYRSTGDQRLRDRLILTFAPLVKYLAFKRARELPAHVEIEDLISCGLEAVMASIDRYDPAKGATLSQYASTRIRGAIVDELRRLDWAPRSLRALQRDITDAKTRFKTMHAREPTEPELAAKVGIPATKLREVEREIDHAVVTSLNASAPNAEDEHELIDLVPTEDRENCGEQALFKSEAYGRLRSAIAELPQRERSVITLLYAQQWTLREIGQALGFSESRACQLHTSAKTKLARLLADDRSLLMAAA